MAHYNIVPPDPKESRMGVTVFFIALVILLALGICVGMQSCVVPETNTDKIMREQHAWFNNEPVEVFCYENGLLRGYEYRASDGHTYLIVKGQYQGGVAIQRLVPKQNQ